MEFLSEKQLTSPNNHRQWFYRHLHNLIYSLNSHSQLLFLSEFRGHLILFVCQQTRCYLEFLSNWGKNQMPAELIKNSGQNFDWNSCRKSSWLHLIIVVNDVIAVLRLPLTNVLIIGVVMWRPIRGRNFKGRLKPFSQKQIIVDFW